VDGTWTVPHFEKMLYDNALLLRVYTELFRLTGDQLARRVAGETVDFLLDGLGTPEGAFASALDADTDGVEGLTYAWTPKQLVEVLGDEDGRWAADLLGVTDAGTFEHGTSVLRLARDIDDGPEVARRWAPMRQRLRQARDRRPQPARDDKVVAEWNGLAITALAEYGALTGDARAIDAAVTAGALIAGTHVVDDRLRRVSRGGAVGEPDGVLADYGSVATAFATLAQVTGDATWLTSAGRLLDTALAGFADGSGGFFDTSVDAEALVMRPSDPTDSATPSGNSTMIEALMTYTACTGEVRYREAAERALAGVAAVIEDHPRFAGLAAACAETMIDGPVEVAIVGPSEASRSALVEVARRAVPGGGVLVQGTPDQPGMPLLAGRPLIGGAAAAYVCRGFVCDRPVTDPDELAAQLNR
jgi:uncharacterized protein